MRWFGQVAAPGGILDISELRSPDFQLGCPEQGLEFQDLNYTEVREFAAEQMRLWSEHPLPFANQNGATDQDFNGLYRLFWQNVLGGKGSVRVNYAVLEKGLTAAREWKFIIAGQKLWNSLQALKGVNDAVCARNSLAFSIFFYDPASKLTPHLALSSVWEKAIDDHAERTLSLSFIEPSERYALDAYKRKYAELADELAIEKANVQSLATDFTALHERLQITLDTSKAEFVQLKNWYQSELKLNATASYWGARSKSANFIGWFSLSVFVGLLVSAFVTVYLNWPIIDAQLEKLMAQSNGTINLTAIVAVSVPVLGFGWLLRHVSRLFIQNLTLADDAKYRQVMTMTFLGLQKDENAGITDTERALILNALFRPTPSNTANEDGPPAGLLDLIKGK